MNGRRLPSTHSTVLYTHTEREPSVVEGSLPFSTHKKVLRVTFLLHHSNTTQTNQVKLKTVTPQHKT
jgi:hypothetical protein